MFTRSIRWRLLLWLALLLLAILSGFGVTAFQLHRANRFSQIDAELARRVAALSRDARGLPPFPPGRGAFGPGEFEGRDRDAWGPGRKGPGPGPRGDDWTNAAGFGPPPRGAGFEEEMDSFPRGLPKDPRDHPLHPPPWMVEFGPDARKIQLSPSTVGLFDEENLDGFYYVIWSRGGRELGRSTNAPAATLYPNPSKTDSRIRTRTNGDYREAYQSTDIGECVMAGRSLVADMEAINRFAGLLIATGAGILLLGLGGGWWLATRAIQPIEAISVTARRISAGNLNERINMAETDNELGRLADVLNSTFARLEAAFAQQKQFTADAAHELRTPLAVLISEAQTTLRRARTPEEYREAIETCLDAAQQMRRLTQSLLELARLDAGGESLERCVLDLAALAEACAEFMSALGQERNIRIVRDLAPASVLGDSDRLSQVLTNLLNNALQYGRQNGEVRISTRVEGSEVVLTVVDDGPGIAAEDLPHVFERFYRGDKSRARAEGHAGLGLAICKVIVEAHGGTISASSELGKGTTIMVRLPAHPSSDAVPSSLSSRK